MNIQELQTVVHHHLPVKIFVLNNSGYLSMRMTQSGFFGRLTGESAASGASLPDMVKVACAYGIPSIRIDRAVATGANRSRARGRRARINRCGARSRPRNSSRAREARQLPDGRIVSPNLEDMYPFLDEGELMDNVIKE